MTTGHDTTMLNSPSEQETPLAQILALSATVISLAMLFAAILTGAAIG